MKPRESKSTNAAASLKRKEKMRRFHYRMTEDLEEALRKLAKQPRDENIDMVEVPSDLIVSVPVQLVCTAALVAVLALPVFYLVSSHLGEEQHFTRIHNLKDQLESFQRACGANICSSKDSAEAKSMTTLQKIGVSFSSEVLENSSHSSVQESPSPELVFLNISWKFHPNESSIMDMTTLGLPSMVNGLQRTDPTVKSPKETGGRPRPSKDSVIHQMPDFFQFTTYQGEGHVAFLSLELVYLRLSMVKIWLDTALRGTNISHQIMSVYELGMCRGLYMAHRILLTAVLDPITLQGLHQSQQFSCQKQQQTFFDLNCTTIENDTISTTTDSSFCRFVTHEDVYSTGGHFRLRHHRLFNNDSCGSLEQYLYQLRLAVRLMEWRHEIETETKRAQSVPHTNTMPREILQNISNGLSNITSSLFAYMERSALDLHYKRLYITYSCVVVYVLVMFLALPTFFSLTLRKREDLRTVSLASRRTLECLSGRVDILDNYILRLLPKCLLKAARKRKMVFPKTEQRKEENRNDEAKLLGYWLKHKLSLCKVKEATSRLDNQKHPECLHRDSSDLYAVEERAEQECRSTKDKTEDPEGNVEYVEDQTALRIDVSPLEVNVSTTNMDTNPPGLKTVYVQSMATESDLVSKQRATPYVPQPECSRQKASSSSSAVYVAATSDMTQRKEINREDFSMFKGRANVSEYPKKKDGSLQSQILCSDIKHLGEIERSELCPDIKYEEEIERSEHSNLFNVEIAEGLVTEIVHTFTECLSSSPSERHLYLGILSPLPEHHRSAPSLLEGYTQNACPSVYKTIASCENESPHSESVSFSNEAVSAPTISVSPSVQVVQYNEIGDPPSTTPLTLVSLTNSAGFSSQTIFSRQQSQCSNIESDNPSFTGTADPPLEDINLASASSSSGVISKDSMFHSPQTNNVSYHANVSSDSSCYSTPSQDKEASRQTHPLPPQTDPSSNKPYSQHSERSVVAEDIAIPPDIRLKCEDQVPTPLPISQNDQQFLRQISVLAVTVPEMQAVLDQASLPEALAILSQLTDLLLERMQHYDVFLVEQKLYTFIFGSGSQGSSEARHIQEVASLALDLMSSLGDLEIDYSCDRKIRPRMGIHTGPCVTFIPSTAQLRCRLVGNVVQHAVRHMELAFPHSILASARTCDLLKTARAPFELTKREYQSNEPRYMQRSRFLSGHLNSSGLWAEEHNSQATTLFHLVTRPKYSFDSDDLYTPTRQRSPDTVQGRH